MSDREQSLALHSAGLPHTHLRWNLSSLLPAISQKKAWYEPIQSAMQTSLHCQQKLPAAVIAMAPPSQNSL
jgi:hypothetical protein